MNRFLLRILLLLLLPCAAFAQHTGKLAGRVVDDLGDPLPGANVIIEGMQLGAATDVDGNYVITGLPAGTYAVTASFVGFPSLTLEVVLAEGEGQRLDFDLDAPADWGEMSPCLWEPPIISKDPFASRSLSGAEIERLPAER